MHPRELFRVDTALAQRRRRASRALLRGDDTDVAGVGRERRSERELVVVALRRDDDRRGAVRCRGRDRSSVVRTSSGCG